MSRKGRRDCRTGDRKKNAINLRVEAMKKSIRKTKKTAAAPAGPAAAEPAAPALTSTASQFLQTMRAEVADGVAATRERILPSSSTESAGKAT